MARMQTILAESLGMARGISSDRKHLSAQQFKTEAKLSDLSKDVTEKEELVAKLRESLEKLKKTVDYTCNIQQSDGQNLQCFRKNQR